MQISRLWSNQSSVFYPIDFNNGLDASRLNVIFGEMRKPKDKKKDAHNLGKTTLLHLIDFLMLKSLSSDHFLSKHRNRFENFVFFIEIALNSGDYVTVRRSVASPTRIGLMRHTFPNLNFIEAYEDAWTHTDLPIDEAVRLLDAWLDLRVLKPYSYRKAITYFLRSQEDWRDELQLSKFQAGKDMQWKPFVAHLFGLRQGPILRKYELDESIARLNERFDDQQAEVQYREDQLPALTARMTLLRQEVDELEAQLDAFNFDEEEKRIVTDLVNLLEKQVAEANQTIYDVRYDIKQIDYSIESKTHFDLRRSREYSMKQRSIFLSKSNVSILS